MRTPWRRAARAFSRMPPTGSTRPDSVISPVIATSGSTGTPRAADTMAVAMVTPADGPSLGIAPAGTWMCRSCLLRKSGGMPSVARLLADVAERRARRLLHDAAELTGEDQAGRRPASATASMKSTSPPASVHATPVATPGREVRNAALRAEPRRPEVGVHLRGRRPSPCDPPLTRRVPRPCARSCRSAARAFARPLRACTP